MKTTKKAVFDFIESHTETIFVFVSMGNVFNEDELRALLIRNEDKIVSGRCGKRRKIAHKSSSKIVFDDDSNLYKTDKCDGNYTFSTGKLIWFVREMAFEVDDRRVCKYMCYAAEV